MSQNNKKLGFTIIEMMLAMGFVSFLLLAIAMTIIQIGNIYNRGLTLKDVDQSGRSIVSELQRNISIGGAYDITNPNYYVADKDFGGRLCLGQYSYIWNYGSKIPTELVDTNSNINKYNGADVSEVIRFVKVFDPGKNYCAQPNKDIVKSDSVELLGDSQHDLAIHSFKVESSVFDAKSQQKLYNISFLLGTNDQLTLDANTCRPPSDNLSDINYCALNEFEITISAGNNIQ